VPPESRSARLLRRAAIAALIGISIGFAVLVLGSHGLETVRGGRIGGDLPAFYGAGRIVRSGDARHLYDAAVQKTAQRDLLPATIDGWIHFAYPPFVALAYVPLTTLPFKTAYVLHTVLMALCGIAALVLVRPALPALRGDMPAALAALLTFYPLFRAIAGGQNTAVSLLCAAGAAGSLARGRDLRAGLWLGAWAFKPQLGIPVCILLALARPHPRRLLTGIAIVITVYYAAAAVVWGPGWPAWWLREGVLPFAAADRIVDRGNGVSIPDLAADLGVPAAGAMACAAAAGLVAMWLARRRMTNPGALTGVLAAATVLAVPHALYYDAGLAALPLVAAAALGPSLVPAVALLWLLAWTQPLRPYLPVPPLTLILACSLWLAARADREPQRLDGGVART
jgi:Glycosyltransferase family 87